MSAEAVAAAAAVAGVFITILGALAVLIWSAGRHSQRLDVAEDHITILQASAHEASKLDTALQVLTNSVAGMERRVDEIGHDVKNLLTGDARPARRRNASSD